MVIETAHLYAPLHDQLVALLEGLSSEDWHKPTVCRSWAVRDIAAHLLDVNIRGLSFSRDQLEIAPPDTDLVTFLNRLNAEWVLAARRRLSPRVLIDLLRLTGVQNRGSRNETRHAGPRAFLCRLGGRRRVEQLV